MFSIKKIVFNFILIFSLLTNGSDAENKLIGNPSLSANDGNIFLNFGGPHVKLETSEFTYGISFFPSIKYNTSSETSVPVLGFGVYVEYDRFQIVVPTYYYSNSWYGSAGIGYKF
jgi:hypothetical protein